MMFSLLCTYYLIVLKGNTCTLVVIRVHTNQANMSTAVTLLQCMTQSVSVLTIYVYLYIH